MNLKPIVAAGILASSVVLGAAANAQNLPYQTTPQGVQPNFYRRGGAGSDRNLRITYRNLGREIARMQHDQHDYDGYRVKAIAEMEQARSDIQAALAYDRGHE